MRRPALVLVGFLMLFAVTATKAQTPGAANASAAPKAIHLPLFFEANQGQTDSHVRFLSRSKGYTLLLTPTETVLAESKTQVSARPNAFAPFETPRSAVKSTGGSVIRMQLVGANSAPAMKGVNELPGKVNYLIGNDSSRWQMNVPLYSKVQTRQVYPGVDLVFHGDQKELEYDFVVAPGADPSKIAFRIRGAARMEIDRHGDLVLHAADSDFVMHKPVIYQTIAAERRPIEGSFVKRGKNEVAFRLGAYDHSQELVIDPAVGFSSFLGGAGDDVSGGLAVDVSTPGSPKLYLGGFTTDSTTFTEPKTVIGFGTSTTAPIVEEVGFVAKIDPTATGAASLVYLTFIGGNIPALNTQKGCASAIVWLTLDKSQGAASIVPVLGGETNCSNFPGATVLNPVTDPTGTSDGLATVAVRMMPSGAAIDKAAVLGGNQNIGGGFIAVNASGNVILTGETQATNLPTKNAYVNTFNNGATPAPFDDCFVTVLNRADLSINYLTYLNVGGGSTSGDGVGCGAFEDASGNILAGGNTVSSTAFNLGPGGTSLANGFQTTFKGTKDTFAMKLNPSLVGVNQLLYATYFAGGGATRAGNGSFDLGNGVVAIVGSTTSNTANGDIPLKNAFQSQNNAKGNGMTGFLALINTLQTGAASLQCGTYFGGTGGDDIVGAVTYDAGDPTNYRIILGGRTDSPTDFPTMNPIQPYVGAVVNGTQSPDGFLSILRVPTPAQAPFNANLVFSTYIGGANPPAAITVTPTPQLLEDDRINAVAVDANHTVYAAGESNAPGGFFANTNPTTTVNGFQTTCSSCSNQGVAIPEDDVVVFSLGTGANATLQSIAVAPTSASITVGQTQQFRAIGNFNDGTEKDITSLVTWTTVPTGFATMSTTSPGLATGTAVGTTQVTPALNNVTVLNTGALTVTAGAVATHFSVSAPANATSGTAFTATVTALDASNATVTTYAGTVHFTSSDAQAVLPANSTLTNGVGTFSVTLKTAGAQTLTATDTVTSSITGTSGTITVGGGTQVNLHVTVAGTALGTVTDNLGQINCEQIVSGQGSGGCTGLYTSGTQVTLTATTPGAFGGFVGAPTACTGTGATCQFTITAAETVTATFNPGSNTFPLTVQAGATHTGGGTVTSTPTGINCMLAGTATSGTCMTNFGAGTLVTLSVTPGGGSTFFGWTGTTPNCLSSSAVSCVVGMSAATTALVGFTSGGGTVNMTVTGPGNVRDTANANTINCTNTTGGTQTGTCASGYALGTPVTLTETPAANATFSGWTGNVCANPTAATCSFTVTAATPPIAVTATFAAGVGPGPVLNISKTHVGNFTQGQQGAQYTVTVSNTGSGPTNGGGASSVTVQSTGSIYATGAGSTAPTMITLPPGATSVVFNSVTGSITTGCGSSEGCIILNHGTGDNPNDPDGVGAVPATSSNTGTSSISGMTAPGAGYLVGLFVPAGGPAGAAPAALNFTSTGLGIAFTSLSPLLDQVFFIGDGLTGNGTGTLQTFIVPAGATQLWLGISDAPGYVGAPGAYGDNLGTYTVNFNVNATGAAAVTVTETAPPGLTLVSMAGTGWTCGGSNPANVCTRSDVLAGGASYPAITVTVNVATDTTSPQVNAAGVTGGGSAPANTTDSTVIVSAGAATHFSVTAPSTAAPGTPISFTVTALDASNVTATSYTGTVHFTSSDGAAALPANSTLTNGVGTFSATLNTAGNQTITATDTVTASIKGLSGTINVSTATGVQLTVQTAGTGTGTVTGNGINCTSGSANGCIVSLPAGTQVMLTEAGTNGSTFGGWNGAPTSCTVAGATCSFTMPGSAETVTATFTAAAATLKSIAVTPANPTEPINSSVQFTATGTFSDNSTKDITSTVTWASSNTEAATISTTGLVTVGGTAGLTTTISATSNEVTGSTLLTVSNSPISISVTPPAGGTFPPVPPGGTLAIGIVLTSTPGFSGTVNFGCSTSSPTITCAPDPATVTLTPNGPTDVAIVLNTFCKGATTAGSVPAPGGLGGGFTLLLLSLTLGSVLWMWKRSPRWAVSSAILVLMAIGGASCASPPKGPNGATQPGNYTVTFTATVNGVTTSTAPIPFTVQ